MKSERPNLNYWGGGGVCVFNLGYYVDICASFDIGVVCLGYGIQYN